MARDLIFFSYRRDDTADVAGRLHDAFAARFGAARLFKDVDDIPPGADFPRHLAEVLPRCGVALVLIGPQWADARDVQGRRRLDDPADWVRVEVEAVLQSDAVRVVPVLVNGARLPEPEALPQSLRPLLHRQAAVVRRDPDFREDVRRLMRVIGPHRSPAWLLAGGAAALLSLGAAAVAGLGPPWRGGTEPVPASAPGSVRVGPEPGSLEDWRTWFGDGHIPFALDRASLDAEARSALDEQAAWLARHARVHVRVIGHAADEGVAGGVSRAYALKLSQRRADSVREHLVARGIDAARIETLAMGLERPADTGTGAQANARNRRVEVVPFLP